jgi:hypothetical protein
MEATRSPETSVYTEPKRRHIPEDDILRKGNISCTEDGNSVFLRNMSRLVRELRVTLSAAERPEVELTRAQTIDCLKQSSALQR